MSGEAGNAIAAPRSSVSWLGDIRTVRILRYVFGSTLAMTVAMGFDWPLAFLTPVLTLSFLGTKTPRPTVKSLVTFVLVIVGACTMGLLVGLLVWYPGVFLLTLALVLFQLFYAKAGGAPPLLITWTLIAVLLIPILASLSDALALVVAGYLAFGSAVAVLVVWLSHIIVPDPHLDAVMAPAPPAAKPLAGAARVSLAALSTLVVFPLAGLFLATQKADAILILVFVAILTLQPSLAAGYKAGIALIVGNVIGGLASMLFYDLLVVVPEFSFMVLLTLFCALVFASGLFSDSKWAPLFGMAFSTVLLIIGSTTSSFGEADTKASTRVFQITIAVVYAVVAFNAVKSLLPRRTS
jgi:hypothetical protein